MSYKLLLLTPLISSSLVSLMWCLWATLSVSCGYPLGYLPIEGTGINAQRHLHPPLWKAQINRIETNTNYGFLFPITSCKCLSQVTTPTETKLLQAHCKPYTLKVLPQGPLFLWMLNHSVCDSFLVSFLSSQFLSPMRVALATFSPWFSLSLLTLPGFFVFSKLV